MSHEHIDHFQRQYGHKIKTVDELCAVIGPRPRDKKVIMCHGVFDIVHPGHVRHLVYAKSKGDILVVSCTADAHVIKADGRPYVPEALRALNLAAFEMIDYVLIDREATPLSNLRQIQPDFFAKGYEYGRNGLHPKTREEMEVLNAYGGEVIFTPGDIVYSSSRLIEMSPPHIAGDKLLLTMQGEGISFDDLRRTTDRLAGVRVHVVGDTIVDSYTECTMVGSGSKTPTLSARFDRRRDYTGGAAIVAKHIRAAGGEVVFSTVMGEDAFRDHVIDDLEKAGVRIDVITDPTRPTTNKNAIVVGGYRLIKVDTLDNRPISEKILGTLCSRIAESTSDVTVFSDFRHGIFNRQTIPALVGAIPAGRFRVADSQVASRWGNILDFKGFDLITPNEREARFALGDQDSVVRSLGLELYRRAECKVLMLKLGPRGMMTFRDGAENAVHKLIGLDSFTDDALDPVGAGDALLAYATLALSATGSVALASILGAFAAAVECEHDGNVPVTPEDIHAKIDAVERQVVLA